MSVNMSLLSFFSMPGIPKTRGFNHAPIPAPTAFPPNSHDSSMSSSSSTTNSHKQPKLVWVWTESKHVMTAAVERGWSTFLFESHRKQLALDWSSIALISALFVQGEEIVDEDSRKVAAFCDASSPEELELLQSGDKGDDTVVISFGGDWQVIPAENLVAAFQGCRSPVLTVSKTSSEAQVFLEALEQGLGGVVLKFEDIEEILKLKDYFDRRNLLCLNEAAVTRVEVVGMGDRVCVDICSLMQPGEGLLVGSFARGLFLVHSECLESNYIASRPFRVNAGPVHAYVAIPGGRTCYLSELQAGKEVLVVNQSGLQRPAIVGRVKIESRPLVLVEAKVDTVNETYSIFLQNAETVGLVSPSKVDKCTWTMIPVSSLKVGDQVMLRVQGGARHTGIEIQEFIVEK